MNTKCEVFSVSPSYLALGFDNGIVKLYDLNKQNQLLKTFQNLKTKVSFMDLNEQFLVFGSKWKNNSVRVYDIEAQNLGKIL